MDPSQRRVQRLLAHLSIPDSFHDQLQRTLSIHVQVTAGRKTVRIGDVSMDLQDPPPLSEHLIPTGYVDQEQGESQAILRVLRFMMQKDVLGQDIYLIGPPGPSRLVLAKKYCELVQRPMEYVALSQDTTESDLKQRREISQGTAEYVDCAAVRAAANGSVLVLDGIEKAERNVMPLLNNLLENREMALEDGRFLVAPKRFDVLRKDHSLEEMTAWNLLRCSDRFRVIALGLPIPRYLGNTLDPPFRSRFQARDVQSPGVAQLLDRILHVAGDATDESMVRALVQCAAVITDLRHNDGSSAISAVPEFPQGYEDAVGLLWRQFPNLHPRFVTGMLYPFTRLIADSHSDERNHVLAKVFAKFGFQGTTVETDAPQASNDGDAATSFPDIDYLVRHVEEDLSSPSIRRAVVHLHSSSPHHGETTTTVPAGEARFTVLPRFVLSETGTRMFARMVQAHSVGDFCLIGEKGGGKSALVHYFAHRFGYAVEHIPLYKDITARGLLQRRTTLPNGDTTWEDSSLVCAALNGRLAVLDGVEQILASTLSTLQQLIHDREVTLPNGTRLMGRTRLQQLMERHQLSRADLAARDIKEIHPSFRVVALARPAAGKGAGSGSWRDWLGPEVACMFRFIYLEPPTVAEQKQLLAAITPGISSHTLDLLAAFVTELRAAIAKDDLLNALQASVSLRQLIRICGRIVASENQGGNMDDDGLFEAIHSASLSRFLPPMVHETLVGILRKCDIQPSASPVDPFKLSIQVLADGADGEVLKIGNVTTPITPPRDPLLVPDIVFHDNPRQTLILMEMLKDWNCGQHLLLIGNQGVGKNKLADRMLELLKLPREYIQLHRDTTVQNLTSNPTIVNGVLSYEDSPLVRAAREGRVLVVDEADKAPTYVTAILKTLVEDHSMLLSDGRRIVDASEIPENQDREYIPLHPEFRVIALANRPGFPFHGNDFFREVGDVFACHAIDNPDAESELFLLRQYGPDVPEESLRKLIAAFDELRKMSDDGQLSYPYSTRELTGIIRHMQLFPKDGIDRILRNVFDFDNYSSDEKDILVNVFAKHGIPFSLGASNLVVNSGKTFQLEAPKLKELWVQEPAMVQGLPGVTGNALEALVRRNRATEDVFWALKSPSAVANLDKRERGSRTFTEEVYNFHLPQGLVLGSCVLADKSLVCAVRSSSFMMYHIDASHARCTTFDLHAALPADGMYRTVPKLASVFEMDPAKNRLGVSVLFHNPSSGMVLAVNTDKQSLVMLEELPGQNQEKSFRILQSDNRCGQFLVYQHEETVVTVLDFEQGQVFTVPLGLEVDACDSLRKDAWLVTGKGPQGSVSTYVVKHIGGGQFDHCLLDRTAVTGGDGEAPVSQVNFVSESFRTPPGGFPEVKFMEMHTNGDVNASPHLVVGLPGLFESHREVPVYSIDDGFLDVMLMDPGSESQAPRRAKTIPYYLRESGLCVQAVELPGVFQVELNVYDIHNQQRRTLVVGLEDDAIGNPEQQKKNDNRHRFTDIDGAGMPKRFMGNTLTASHLSQFSMRRATIGQAKQRLFVVELDERRVMTIDCLGWCRVWLVDERAIRESFSEWRKLVGTAHDKKLRIMYDSDEDDQGEDGEGDGNGSGKGKGNGNGKGEGEGDGEGNGSGDGSGSGTVGGGQGGSLTGNAKGKDIADISELPDPGSFEHIAIDNPNEGNGGGGGGGSAGDEEQKKVDEVTKELKKGQWKALLDKIEMSEFDFEKYEKYKEAVSGEIRELRVILEGLEARQHERVWLKNQSNGDLDDQKLIDGLTGERAIYKRRSDQAPDSAFYQPLPKRMHFLFDLSMSMSRYAADGRLERSLEAAVMVMEALKGFEHKYSVKLSGHSGDSHDVELVNHGKFPKNDKERLAVLKKMHGHAEMCDSGDNTLEATSYAVREITREEGDDYFVFLVSDANLDQYSITPADFQHLIQMDKRVHVFAIFIASMGDQAVKFEKALPGKVFSCLDKAMLPRTLKQMFLNAALK